MEEKADEHDTQLSSYLRLVIHNPAFGILFLGELIDNVSCQQASSVDLYLHCRQHRLHIALLCPTTSAVSNAGFQAALQLVLQLRLH